MSNGEPVDHWRVIAKGGKIRGGSTLRGMALFWMREEEGDIFQRLWVRDGEREWRDE